MLDVLLSKGSNGLLVNNKVLFIIETKKVPSGSEWLFSVAEKFGIDKSECCVIGNNPDPSNHHICHAYAAYAQSGFQDASILVIDGCDEPGGNSIAIYEAIDGNLKKIRSYSTNYSLGTLYSVGVILCGFERWDHAGRLMGAAAYADPNTICPPFFLVDSKTGDITEDCGKLNYDMFDNCLFSDKNYLIKLLGENYNLVTTRKNDGYNFDFRLTTTAATIQYLFEQSVFSLLDYMHNTLPSKNLIITGGCGLNCVANGKIIRSEKWKDLFIPNMCEDQGNIVGRMVMEYGQKIKEPFIYNKITYPIPKAYNKIISKEDLANRIRNGQIVAWFEGGSEYGPRALCHRSILANPLLKRMSYRVNEVKNREYCRPLAPVVLDTHFKEIFDVDGRIWYPHKVMLATEYIRPKWQRKIQSVCAPDNSSRPQVLTDNKYNHTLYSLMSEYDLPILMNTSMNGAGEPICETPEDAIKFSERNSDVLLVFVENDKIYIKE